MAKRKKPVRRKKHGFCKLTHRPGMFVDSHLIPQAFTRPTKAGAPLFQYGDAPRPSRRWTSWYDSELVTRDGEDILSALDTWAASVLRKHKLVWSGWDDDADIGDLHTKFSEHLGIREVELDTEKLRLFFFSLLWRAAASDRYEFKDVTVSTPDLERLRLTLLGQEDPELTFFPVQLTQISTRGIVHNQTPYPDVKYIPNLDDPDATPEEMPTIRFYFDGLIAHIATKLPASYDAEKIGNLVLGAGPTVVLSTVTFEDSVQGNDMLDVLRYYHPEDFHDEPPVA